MTEQKFKIFLEGHGCSASMADTEILGGLITQGGYELVDDETDSDLSVIVTCSVKKVTEERMAGRIKELSTSGSGKLVVAGCLAKAEPWRIERIDNRLSMIGPENLDCILPAIESTLRGEKRVEIDSSRLVKLGMPRTRKNGVVGIVEISSGCLSSCTFCQVKLVKGVVFSYPENEIVEEVRRLVEQGAREVWLTSTDNAAYGRDAGTTLPGLIRRVCAIPGNFKVRIGMMNPLLTGRILEDLVNAYENEKVFKFLHLPVQSGSNRILKAMQRGYTIEDFCATLNEFRSAIPHLTVSTDMIVGFPSESEREFEDSLDLLRRARPDIVNISRYGSRPGTKAALMDSSISNEESKNRSTAMTHLVKQISRENNEHWIGWRGSILIDEKVKNAVVGRNFSYKPCLVMSREHESEKCLGFEREIRITGATASTLRGDLL